MRTKEQRRQAAVRRYLWAMYGTKRPKRRPIFWPYIVPKRDIPAIDPTQPISWTSAVYTYDHALT